MSSMGTRTGRPAISPSLAGRGSPSSSETSVEVPPMSKEMMRSNPLRRAIAAAPTTPPAGPESTVRTGCAARSEEHTSELQSHVNLVCRLLLEKKKKKKNAIPPLIKKNKIGWDK